MLQVLRNFLRGEKSPPTRSLPGHHWPIFLLSILFVVVIAAAIAVTLGLDPYIAGSVGGGVWVLRKTWLLGRHD